MGVIILIVLLCVEALFLIWSVATKCNHCQEKSIVRIAELLLLCILLATGVLEWGFRYYMPLLVLTLLAINGASILLKVRKKQKPYKTYRSVIHFISCAMLLGFSLSVAILFPQYKPLPLTGELQVATAKYTWVDDSRKETFSAKDETRALTIEFWYPETGDTTYPLVVFSHGSFGLSDSNNSTFAELASNGYVVASIGHTYHALYTKDVNGKLTIADMDFLNTAMAQSNTNYDAVEFANTHEWLKLRVDDENFVLDTILENAQMQTDSVFTLINTDKIGVFGHSLGGASSVQLGRVRKDINAVINLDGSLLGEELAFENGNVILNDTPYPVPLLNIFSQSLCDRACEMLGEEYEIFPGAKKAVCYYEVVAQNAGHLNLTDLPLFFPALAKLLGAGTVDARDCIEKTNAVILQFFDCYLKDKGTPMPDREY